MKGPKDETLARVIRERVVTGRMKPGTRLPNRVELLKEHDVSPQTLQRALDRLVREGFVVPRGRAGTFVTNRPPHLHRIALIFPNSPPASDNRFFSALQMVAQDVANERDRTLLTFHGIDGHIDSPEYARLEEDVVRHRVAGMIFATNPSVLYGSPVLHEPDVPRVAFAATGLANVATVFPDFVQLARRALHRLAEMGAKRIGVIVHHSISPEIVNEWLGDLQSLGLQTRPEWKIGLSVYAPGWVGSAMHLLMDRPPADRPDGLLILDDHLVEPALSALQKLGIIPGRAIHIVAHNNFPLPLAPEHQITRIGFDARQMLEKCFELINTQRTSDPINSESLMIAPFFEEEVIRVTPVLLPPHR